MTNKISKNMTTDKQNKKKTIKPTKDGNDGVKGAVKLAKDGKKSAKKVSEKATNKSKKVRTDSYDNTKSLQVLSDLYKNVTMAQNAVKTILPYVGDFDFTKQLHCQVEAYDKYTEQIGTLAEKLDFDPTPAPQVFLQMAGMGIRMKMMTDKSPQHVAKIMLQGTLNGLIKLYRLDKLSDSIHPDVASMTGTLLKFEEKCFDQMKQRL